MSRDPVNRPKGMRTPRSLERCAQWIGAVSVRRRSSGKCGSHEVVSAEIGQRVCVLQSLIRRRRVGGEHCGDRVRLRRVDRRIQDQIRDRVTPHLCLRRSLVRGSRLSTRSPELDAGEQVVTDGSVLHDVPGHHCVRIVRGRADTARRSGGHAGVAHPIESGRDRLLHTL
jgi:hypothetical protein